MLATRIPVSQTARTEARLTHMNMDSIHDERTPDSTGQAIEGKPPLLGNNFDAAEPDSARTIEARRHKQILAMLVVPESLGKVPPRASWTIVASTAHNRGAGMVVGKFIRPLPHISCLVPAFDGLD